MGRSVVEEFEHDQKRYLLIAHSQRRANALSTLTPSELEVVEHWIEGATMREIASRRRVGAPTIAKQIASAYAKLGVSTRAELLKRLQRLSR